MSTPIIAGIEITTDAEGRFNLNSLHRAGECGPNKAPAQWLRTQAAKELIAQVEKTTVQICIVSVEGRSGGTFGAEQLAVAYANWISPEFYLQVIDTFLAVRKGDQPAPTSPTQLTRMTSSRSPWRPSRKTSD